MRVSIVVVTYNRPHCINICLNSLERQTIKPDEIIVIDSSDNDKTERILREERIVYKRVMDRVYQPQARNSALKIAEGDIIVFVDDDVFCVPKWLESIIQGFSFENVVGVGGPVIVCDENLRPLEKIKLSDKNQNFFSRAGDIRVIRAWIPSKPVRTKLMMGGNMSFLKEKLKEVGGFDEFFGRGGAFREETDPQIALIKKGYDFMYMPGAVVYHFQSKEGGIRTDNLADYCYWCGKYHKHLADKYFPKWLSRPSWIFWSFDPPCLWICVLSTLIHRDLNALKWIRGLWSENGLHSSVR